MNRLAKVSLIVIAMLVALMIGGVVYADGPPAEEGVTLMMGGVQKPVRVGEVVYPASSRSVPSGSPPGTPAHCNIPELDLTVSASSGISGITLTLSNDCAISVTEIARSGDAEVYDTAEIRYEGWVKSELNDPWGIDLAAIRSRVEYTDFGDYLASASGAFAHCTVFGYQHGWRLVNCQWTSSANRNRVVVQGVGNYTHIMWPQMAHWQEATFEGYPGGYDYRCRFPQIDVPDHLPELHFKCRGGRVRLDD